MTDDNPATAFLAEQKRLADAATKGPWVSHLLEEEKAEPILTPSEDVAWKPRWYIPKLAWTAERADTEFIIAARSSHPRMVKALEAVMAMHLPYMPDAEERPNFRVCDSCLDSYEDYVPYPCATVRAITAALEGEETNE